MGDDEGRVRMRISLNEQQKVIGTSLKTRHYILKGSTETVCMWMEGVECEERMRVSMMLWSGRYVMGGGMMVLVGAHVISNEE